MSASRITASVSTLARIAPRLTRVPTTAVAWVWSRHASTKPSNDEHTLAKSADMLNALMGSTLGLSAKSSTSTPSPLRLSPAPQPPQPPAVDGNTTAPDMFIPPAHDPLLNYITAVIQRHGHRARAARTVSRMLLHIHTFTRAPPTPIVREAIMAAAPAVRVVSFKYGTKVMMTPHPLTEKQRVRAGLKAIIAASESRPGKNLEVRLAREMIAAVQGESRSLDEKERTHKLAMVNRGNLRR
ncbi:Ribosomal protein S7 domain containing protein [Tylopilus felleus]